MPDLPPPEECANCGAPIPPGAKACPECGADERTGWRETSVYDGLELPETAYGDEDASDADRPPKRHVNGVPWYWWAVGVLLILFLIAGGFWLR